jgi:hypothetical protein
MGRVLKGTASAVPKMSCLYRHLAAEVRFAQRHPNPFSR